MGTAPFTAKRGGLFIQPGGPNTACYYLGCHTLGDLTEKEKGVELLRCLNPEGDGWRTVGNTITPPDPVEFSIECRMAKTRSWIQSIEMPASFYVLQSETGRRDNIKNYDAGNVIVHGERTQKTKTNMAHMEEDKTAMVSADWQAYPPVYEVDRLVGERKTTAATDDLNDVWMNPDAHDAASWGTRLYRGQLGLIVGESDAGPALATCLFATDYANTLAPAAADPFAAGQDIRAGKFFYVGQNLRRYLVAMEPPAGGQGMVAYSDDGGATWTQVNIGGAVAGHGGAFGSCLWAPNENFVLLASTLGYIYKSIDGGASFDAVESGTITADGYGCIHADETDTYCVAGAPADIIALSDDGGETWVVSPADTGSGADIISCWRFDEQRMWVGTDDGELWYSGDGGLAWVQQTRFPGPAGGTVSAMYWVNDHIGYVLYTVGGVATLCRTFNGGYDWEVLTTPANSGGRAVMAPAVNLAYIVGDVEAGTGFIARFKSVGMPLLS